MEIIQQRNGDQKSTFKTPSNISRIYTYFQSYLQKYHRCRRTLSRKAFGMEVFKGSTYVSDWLGAVSVYRFNPHPLDECTDEGSPVIKGAGLTLSPLI